jgi:hypothetical protein
MLSGWYGRGMSDCSDSPPTALMSHTERLLAGGFVRAGVWRVVSDVFRLESVAALPRDAGVYAYVVDGTVCYVGSAQSGLHVRLRHYEIARTLRTAHRVREKIKELLADEKNIHKVEVFILVPRPLYWRGLPINMVAGVEEGLIRELKPIWNIRGRAGLL